MKQALLLALCIISTGLFAQQKEMKVRIAEIEIHPQYISQYNAILKEEAAASVRLEPGVIAIFPMLQKQDSTQVRILEIYRNEDAYQQHLQSVHFKQYKSSTLKMVKSLRIVDMNTIDEETLSLIFKKLKS